MDKTDRLARIQHMKDHVENWQKSNLTGGIQLIINFPILLSPLDLKNAYSHLHYRYSNYYSFSAYKQNVTGEKVIIQ
jgi:hypothetical protein